MVTLGDDIIANNDLISFSYSKFHQQGGSVIEISSSKLVVEGIFLENFPLFLEKLNSSLASTVPVKGASDYTAFSLGYIKNGTKVWPANCQNIRLKLENSVNFNESGCIDL